MRGVSYKGCSSKIRFYKINVSIGELVNFMLLISYFVLYQSIIFSISRTRMPSAPRSFNCSIISQKVSSLITECTEDQPAVANGSTVGAFIPGKTSMISCSLSLGAFSRIYLFSAEF